MTDGHLANVVSSTKGRGLSNYSWKFITTQITIAFVGNNHSGGRGSVASYNSYDKTSSTSVIETRSHSERLLTKYVVRHRVAFSAEAIPPPPPPQHHLSFFCKAIGGDLLP